LIRTGDVDMNNRFDIDPIKLFSMYMRVAGVPHIEEEPDGEPLLRGKRLGVVNGASWISLWTYYFGKMILPGVKIINVGNEAVQLNFMKAHKEGNPCPPQINIDTFVRYARDLYDLFGVDAILISCSTMNRSAQAVRNEMARYNVSVIQIDEAMMEAAVENGGKILVVATHGPTVKSTQALLQETAERLHREVKYTGVTVEEAFDLLGQGRIAEHNQVVAQAIQGAIKEDDIAAVVLAQLSMTVFKFSYPDPVKSFGLPVLTSGECGFLKVKEVLMNL
jgi:Asp/Glu/hydantoin racemase